MLSYIGIKMKTPRIRPVANFSRIYNQIQREISVTSESIKEETPARPWTDIPGPSSLPIIGPMRHFMKGGDFYKLQGTELTQKLNKMYGPIVRLDAFFGMKAMVFLFDAEASSQILRGENQMPIRPGFDSLEYYRKIIKKNKAANSPTGLITDHGERWQEFRSAVQPVLLQPKTMRLYIKTIDDVAMDMIERLKSLRDNSGMIQGDLGKEMNLWSLETMAVVALGCRINCFDSNIKNDSPVHQLIDVVQNILRVGDELDFKPNVWKLYATSTYKQAMKYYEKQEILAKHFINQAIQEFKSNPKPDEEKGILEKLLEINEDYALIMATDMLLAGVDTAANTALGGLYLIATNPDKQAKLREELKSGSEKKPYLKACVKEAIRMMPVASGNIREVTKDYNILGYYIPVGLRVAFAHQDMSRMEQYFVKPNEFLPERWIAEKDDPLFYRNAHPFAYNPFGFGVRSCIGRRIAEMELETFIARAVEHFEIEWFGPPPKVVQRSINYVTGPYNFIFKDAKI